jgi:hypothetical protein
MEQPQDKNEPKEERKLQPYHYEAMIRAEVEKRLAAQKTPDPPSQPIYPPAYYESPPPHLARQPLTGFPGPLQQSGQPFMPPQPNNSNHYPQAYQQSGQLPYYPQPYQQPYPPQYSQPQPPPYYPPPPAQPQINVVVQNTNVNQNVNRNYLRAGYRGRAAHGHIGCFNFCYFIFIGWMLGMCWGFVGLCVLPFNRVVGDSIMRQAFFLAFLA